MRKRYWRWIVIARRGSAGRLCRRSDCAAGTKLAVKSLENETGITIVADPDIYIMIGRRGEVYHIRKDKFLATYEPTEEPLDIFTQMLDFIPVVETVSDGGYISIDEMARLCYPKTQAVICCQELKKRTRVFRKIVNRSIFWGDRAIIWR